ncbi:hypothetical protein TSUD_93250 [Trifolium subterraneum]|uniref:Uncharacterized protein n=1 Tax=Trifolium subterraneum TaxID=3900 RepID=A0A2Z6N092_TRISU|nr:hypothetical protein TSUD_93250 [Trifolium subterraneum]
MPPTAVGLAAVSSVVGWSGSASLRAGYPAAPIDVYPAIVPSTYPTAVFPTSAYPSSPSPTTTYSAVSSPVTVNRRLPR